MAYLIGKGVLEDSPTAIAKFIFHTNTLNFQSLDKYLQNRPDVLEMLVNLLDFTDMFLPDALRAFFSSIPAPNERGRFLENLLDKFSMRFTLCNLNSGMSKGKEHVCMFVCEFNTCVCADTVFVICYSLIMLSVDLTSPHVKNKMSKREFIRNVRQATARTEASDEVLGHMYDNIYLSGHVATNY